MYSEKSSQVTLYPPKIKNTLIKTSQEKKKLNLGKIYHGPLYTAYNRKTLGSIPSSTENILYQKNNGEILRFSFNINEKEINEKETENPNKPNIKNNIILSPRFNYSNIEKEKYFPGPGQYNTNNISSFKNNDIGNYRYNGIFNFGRDEIPINLSDNNYKVGPGKYDQNLLKNHKNIYISPFNRFKKSKHEFYKKILGPGAYDVNLNFGEKYKNGISSFFQTEVNNKKNKKIIIEDNNENNNSENSPGPGSYNLTKNFIKKNYSKDNLKKYKYISDIKNEIKKKIKNDDNDDFLIVDNNDKIIIEECEHKLKDKIQKLKGFTMEKNIPRFAFPGRNKNYFPGPCYYNPKLHSGNYEFNSNEDNKWIY